MLDSSKIGEKKGDWCVVHDNSQSHNIKCITLYIGLEIGMPSTSNTFV